MSQLDHPEFAVCKSCYCKFDECTRSPMILPCTHRLCLKCHTSKWTGDCDDNPYIECPYCNARFYREEKNASIRNYHPVKDIWFSQALNAGESLKEKLKQMEAERCEIIDRHATALEEARKFFSDLAEKTMSEARTINHFYHK